MAQDISWLGNTYSDVPEIYLPKSTSGEALFIDPSPTTAEAADVLAPKIFFNAQGVQTVGTGSGGGGGGSSYTLLGSKELTVSTTSTSVADIANSTITATRSNHHKSILYIQVRDKAGPRNGYFYGTDTYWMQPAAGSTQNNYRLCCTIAMKSGSIQSLSTSQYGVYPKSPPTFSSDSVSVSFVSRYSSSYSLTVNGTYVVKVYDLKFADNDSPFDD